MHPRIELLICLKCGLGVLANVGLLSIRHAVWPAVPSDAHDHCDTGQWTASSCSVKPSSSLSLAPSLLVCESRHSVSVA